LFITALSFILYPLTLFPPDNTMRTRTNMTMRLLSLLVSAFFAAGAVAGEVTHRQAAAAFAHLLETSNSKVSVSEESGVSVGEATAVTIAGTSYETAVKVWFQLTRNEAFVNPALHRWSPKEKFKVFVQSSVPVFFAIYQTYPDDRPPTRQIYPDKKYPKTFYAVPAGKIFEIPVAFETDNDLRKEIIQLTFARVDEPALGGTVVVTAPATPGTDAGTAGPSPNVPEPLANQTDPAPAREPTTTAPRGVLMQAKNVNVAMDHLSKFAVAVGSASTPSVSAASSTETSANRDDVALYVLGIGKTAQTQLTLNK
jgi:hypothetical protein